LDPNNPPLFLLPPPTYPTEARVRTWPEERHPRVEPIGWPRSVTPVAIGGGGT